jgi:ABC-type siderophore export system fused ATPase/permease subunit
MWEFFINIIWMILGVIFYSVLVASVTSNISAEANNADKLASTLKSLDDFKKETHLDDELVMKIRQFLINN